MPRLVNAVPKYRRHRASGQDVVTLEGRDHYLGPYGTKASKAEYDRLVVEWLAAGRQAPPTGDVPLTVAELISRYWKFAKGYYRKNGHPTRTLDNVKDALRPLKKLFGTTAAEEFDPKRLKALRAALVERGLSRRTINDRVEVVKRMFGWAAAEELVPATVHYGLRAVRGLQKGRSAAREPAPVQPVEDAVVDTTMPHLLPVVADMVRFQRLTGARPGEVCLLRPADVDRSGEVWKYIPAEHKTEHHGRQRVVYLGPQAQAVLAPYLLRAADAYCYTPAEAERKRREAAHARRKTPLSCGNRPGTNKKHKGGRKWRERYTPNAYLHAVRYAVTKANAQREKEGLPPLPRWSPNQLRHTAATEIRREFGLEAAQVILGHSKADVTQVYAERDAKLAEAVARKIG